MSFLTPYAMPLIALSVSVHYLSWESPRTRKTLTTDEECQAHYSKLWANNALFAGSAFVLGACFDSRNLYLLQAPLPQKFYLLFARLFENGLVAASIFTSGLVMNSLCSRHIFRVR
jgi:hypothetical protein